MVEVWLSLLHAWLMQMVEVWLSLLHAWLMFDCPSCMHGWCKWLRFDCPSCMHGWCKWLRFDCPSCMHSWCKWLRFDCPSCMHGWCKWLRFDCPSCMHGWYLIIHASWKLSHVIGQRLLSVVFLCKCTRHCSTVSDENNSYPTEKSIPLHFSCSSASWKVQMSCIPCGYNGCPDGRVTSVG